MSRIPGDLAILKHKWEDNEFDISHLIFESEDIIVFLDAELDIDWITGDKYVEPDSSEMQNRNQVLNQAAGLECIPNSHHNLDIRINFKRMVGEGVARALCRDYESAETMLGEARAYIEDRNIETARLWQLSTSCIMGVCIVMLGLIAWTIRDFLIRAWSTPVYDLVLAGGAGALGAVLSMIFRMGSSYPTSEAPKSLHFLEAISRVFAGVLSGLLISSAIRSGLVLPMLSKSDQMQTALLVAAMVSGASERLAPSLIAQIEKNSNESNKEKKKTI